MPIGLRHIGDFHATGEVLSANTKHANLAATDAPTATDDADSRYAVGSLWVDITLSRYYVCVDATVGAAIWVNIDPRVLGHLQFFNGTFLEPFDALVTSNGSIITMTLEKSGGGDLTMNFSDGQTTFDCTPAATIPLTPGDDDDPAENHVYILRSNKILTVSTDDWPTAEHIRVGLFIVPSASLVNTGATGNNFVYGNQNVNDPAMGTGNQGHLTHITDFLRHGGARWHNGCEGVATQDGNDLWVSVAEGEVHQIHLHTFMALDSKAPTSDPILVVNEFGENYRIVHSLNELETLSDGSSIGVAKYVKVVLSGVASKTGEVSLMMIHVPDGQYNTAADAATDVEGFANFSMPRAFAHESNLGFLIASFVCQHTASGMILQSTQDLRGDTDGTAPGAGTGGGDVTAAAAMADNAVIRGDGGAKGVQDSGVLIDDSGNVTGVNDLTVGGDIAVTGTVDGVDVAGHAANADAHHAKAHTLLDGDQHTDTADITPTSGDLISSFLGEWFPLPIGDLGTILIAGLSVPVWATAADAGLVAKADARATPYYVRTPTNSDDQAFFFTPVAITITHIIVKTDVGTVDLNIEARAQATPDVAGTDVMVDELVASSTSADFSGGGSGWNDNTIAANTWLAYTSSDSNGSPQELWIALAYVIT